MQATRSVAFDGQDLCVIVVDAGSRSGVVTFGTWLQQPLQQRPASAAKGFGEGIFTSRGIDELHIVPRRNHWYQSPEMADAARLAREFCQGRQAVTYGSSMGGYGAALFSARLGVPAVCLAPQFSLDPAVAPWETRWREDAKSIQHFDTAAMTRYGRATGFLFYDPFTRMDAMQAALFRGRSDFCFIPCALSGHATAAAVNRIYGLKRLVDDVLGGTFQPSSFSAARRIYGRHDDDHYLALLYISSKTRHAKVAAWAEARLLARESRVGLKALSALTAFEKRRQQPERAAHWAAIAAAQEPPTAANCLVAARLANEAKLPLRARALLERGLELAPWNAMLRRELDSLPAEATPQQ